MESFIMHNSENVVPIVVGVSTGSGNAGSCGGDCEGRFSEIEGALTALREETERLRGLIGSGTGSDCGDCSARLAELGDRVTVLGERLEGLTATVEALRGSLPADVTARLDALGASVAELRDAVDAGGGRLTTLEGCCGSVRAAIDGLTSSLAATTARADAMESADAGRDTRLDALEGAQEELDRRVTASEEQGRATGESLDGLRSTVENNTRVINLVDGRVTRLAGTQVSLDDVQDLILEQKGKAGGLAGLGLNGKIDRRYLPTEDQPLSDSEVKIYGLVATDRVMGSTTHGSTDKETYEVVYNTVTESLVLAMPFREGEFNINNCEVASAWADKAAFPLDTEHIYTATSTGKHYRYDGRTLVETTETPGVDEVRSLAGELSDEMNALNDNVTALSTRVLTLGSRVQNVERLGDQVSATAGRADALEQRMTANEATDRRQDLALEGLSSRLDGTVAAMDTLATREALSGLRSEVTALDERTRSTATDVVGLDGYTRALREDTEARLTALEGRGSAAGGVVNAQELLGRRGETMTFGEVLEALPAAVRFPGVIVTYLGADGWHTMQWTNATAWGVEANWEEFTMTRGATEALVKQLTSERFAKILKLLGLADETMPPSAGGCNCKPVGECENLDIDEILG